MCNGACLINYIKKSHTYVYTAQQRPFWHFIRLTDNVTFGSISITTPQQPSEAIYFDRCYSYAFLQKSTGQPNCVNASLKTAKLLRDSVPYLQLLYSHLLCIKNLHQSLFLSCRGPYLYSFHFVLSLAQPNSHPFCNYYG